MSLARVVHKVRSSKFIKDVALLQASGVTIQVSQFVSSVVIAFLLGARGQGGFNLAITLQAVTFFLVSVGLVPATVSQVAAASARKQDEKVTQWLAFLLKAVFLSSALIFALGFLILPTVGERVFGDRQLGVWAWWLTAVPLLDLPRWVAVAAFQGTRRMQYLARVDSGQELLRVFLVIVGAIVTGTAEGAILGQILGTGLTSLVAMDLYARARHQGSHLPGVRELLANVRGVPLRRGLRLGIRVGLLKNANVVILNILPRLLLGGFSGLEWVAYFHIAQRIMGIPMNLMRGVTRNMLPALSELVGVQDMKSFRRLFVRTTFVGGSIVTLAILAGLVLIPFVLAAAFPEDYADPVFTNAKILAIGFVPMAFIVALEPFYIATSKLKVSMLISIFGHLVCFPANVALVWTLPEYGAAWGQSLYMSWALVHLAYVAYHFGRSRSETSYGPIPTGGPAPGSS